MTKKTVLITGCSSGFGRLTAKKFAAEGWNVVATARNPEHLEPPEDPDRVLLTRLDVTDPQTIKAAVAQGAARFGAIDVLVNNAGFGGSTVFEQTSEAAIRAMYETNVFGVMNVTRAVLPLMRRQGAGCVINVTSVAAMFGIPINTIYCSSKFAVEGFTEALALECKPLNILAKTVAPGAFPTTRFGANTKNDLEAGDEALVRLAGDLAQRVGVAIQSLSQGAERPGDPEDVAYKIYECATTDTPVHNPVGDDAIRLARSMDTKSRQDFLDHIEALVFPAA